MFWRFLLTDYGKSVAEKHGFSEDIDENGCVFAKVYYQLLRKTSRRKRWVLSKYIVTSFKWLLNLSCIVSNVLLILAALFCLSCSVKFVPFQTNGKTVKGLAEGRVIRFRKKVDWTVFIVFSSSANSIDNGRKWCGGRYCVNNSKQKSNFVFIVLINCMFLI